jgi:hypothetical protein
LLKAKFLVHGFPVIPGRKTVDLKKSLYVLARLHHSM